MRVRVYGESGPMVIVLHGGPAAVGEAAPIARGLAHSFRVLEPWQRGSGDQPLSVARHIADLHALVISRCDAAYPALVGASWGAMLALAYAAAHPGSTGPIVLVGCGTFDKEARARLRRTLDERTDDELQRALSSLQQVFPDPDERLKRTYELTRKLYHVDPLELPGIDPVDGPFDVRAHNETWQDMVRLQEEGVYPAAFAAITSTVLMLHGAEDPHPGQMIRASLQPFLPQLEYHQWDRCGHSPWLERAIREDFFAVMCRWLKKHLAGTL
jgi:pimeloyl-ACP methyl ester carboxylesterase